MTNKKEIAPSLQDLSYAQVESSRFFGFTNTSGKVLSLLSFVTLLGGAAGVAQGLGYMGPVLGTSLSFTGGLVTLGASVTAALVGYWLGNFDDKKIKAHNSRVGRAFSSARHTKYESIENGFIQALSNVQEYDPAKNSLPYDALGHAVMMSDDKIDKLPPHVRIDVYRTQMDIELYRHRQLTSHRTVEGRAFEEKTFRRPTMIEKATEYKRCRDFIRAAIASNTLVATPVGSRPDRAPENARRVRNDDDDLLLADVALDALDVLGRGLRNAPRTGGGGFRSGGGGDFGGAGASGSWNTLASPQVTNVASGAVSQGRAFLTGGMGSGMDASAAGRDLGNFDFGSVSSGSSSSSGSSDFEMPDLGDDPRVVLVIAGVAAVVAACAASGAYLWKNFISKADAPTLNGVHVPMISHALATAEKDIRRMYKPS